MLDGESLVAASALKRTVLETGTPSETDVSIRIQAGDVHWYDLHVEPLRDVTGDVTGLIGAAIDVTSRKEDEAHLRLLMRELTHRSKNLLAVIQAMARQTARHARSIEQFLEQFEARLQALATSHDVLIEEGWHGASLGELVEPAAAPPARFADRSGHHRRADGAAQARGGAGARHRLPRARRQRHQVRRAVGSRRTGQGQLAPGAADPQGDSVDLRWEERDGPEVSTPVQRRFGSVIIERYLAHAIDGEVQLSFPREGVVCTFHIPPAHLVGFTERAGNRLSLPRRVERPARRHRRQL